MIGDNRGNPKIWLVRHGLSIFNYWSRTYGHRAGECGTPDQDPDYVYLKEIRDKLDTRLADPALHKKGIAQALKAQDKINKMNVKYVFVSPLRRTLETCRCMFENYPHKDQVHFVVHPLVRELMGSPCDVPVDTLKDRRKEYEALGYDFSLLDKFDQRDLFFLYSMNSPEREELFAEIGNNRSKPYIQVIADVLRRRRKTNSGTRKIESFVNARERAAEFAKFLLKFIPNSGLKEGDDIVVVSHSLFISYSTATYWTPNGSISTGNIPHCEPIDFDYNWIVKLANEFSCRQVFLLAMLRLLPKMVSKPKAEPKCSQGHRMHFSHLAVGSYVCSQCKRLRDSVHGLWHCVMCNETVCEGCCELAVPDKENCKGICESKASQVKVSGIVAATPCEVVALGPKNNMACCEHEKHEYGLENSEWTCSYSVYDICPKYKTTVYHTISGWVIMIT